MSGLVQAPKAPRATEESVKKPRELVRHINDIGALATALAFGIQRIPISLGNLLTGVKFTAGTTNYISHGLGRPYLGYVLVNAPSVTDMTLTTVFRASGTYVAPVNCSRAILIGCGGGGGGGGGASGGAGTGFQAFGGSGGGGAQLATCSVALTPGASYTVTVGSGGAGGSAGVAGFDGGSTTFGSLATFTGAGGGLINPTATSGAGGAVCGGSNIASAPLSVLLSTGNQVTVPIVLGAGFGGFAFARGSGGQGSTSGAPSIQGFAGGAGGASGANSGSERGGGGGGGGGGGPFNVYNGNQSNPGGSGGNGNNAGAGFGGTRPDGTVSSSAQAAASSGSGAGGGGGGAGGYGSTSGGAGGGGQGGDCGQIQVIALLPSLLSAVTLPSGKTSDKFIGLVSAVSGTFDILVF